MCQRKFDDIKWATRKENTYREGQKTQ